MDPIAMIAGAVLLIAGTIFALSIGRISGKDEAEREHLAGS